MAAITSNGTGGGNWSAGASWTGAAVPGEGDTVTIQNGDTITIDQDITVGADSATAAIDVASGGKLSVPSTVAADYTLTCKGDLKISSGGTLEIGTVANPIPSTRIFIIKLNYSATLSSGEFGLLNYGDMIIQGTSKTSHTLLTSDLAATGTVWTVGDTTGWEAGDKVAITSTTSTHSQREQEVIQTVDSGTQITCVAGVSYAHSGTSLTQAEVINLTRNIVITSYNTSYPGYVYCLVGSTSDVDYVEFCVIGISSSTKYGIEIRTTAANATNFNGCSVWFSVTSISYSFFLTAAQNVVINNCVTYNIYYSLYLSSSHDCTITNNVIIYSVNGRGLHIASSADSIFTGNRVASCKSYGIYISSPSYAFTTFSDNVSHSCDSYGIYITTLKQSTMSNLTVWRNDNYGIYINGGKVNLDTITLLGNKTYNLVVSSGKLSGNDWTIDGDSITTYGIGIAALNIIGIVDTVLCGTNTTHSTADIYFSSNSYGMLTLLNSKLDSATKVKNIELSIEGSYVQCEDFDQVVYADKAWYVNGIVVRDSSTYKYGSYATRFDFQYNNTEWLEYDTYIPVTNGEQIVISAWLRKNASYTDANRPKITISGQGITENSDQMSNVTDTWERVTVSGTPTRTGLAKLTISTYLVNASASAWVDFEKTDVLTGVLNTIEGDYWANGHIAEVFMDTGSITAAEFWKTLLADVDQAGSFANLLEDYIDAAISSRAQSNEYDAVIAALQADLNNPDQYKADVSNLDTAISTRAPANEYDIQMGYIPSNLGDVPTAAELIAAHGSGAWTAADVSALATAIELAKVGKKVDRNFVVKL